MGLSEVVIDILAIGFIFLSVLEEKMQLIEKLKYLMECNTYNHLRETFEFTLSLFEKDLI